MKNSCKNLLMTHEKLYFSSWLYSTIMPHTTITMIITKWPDAHLSAVCTVRGYGTDNKVNTLGWTQNRNSYRYSSVPNRRAGQKRRAGGIFFSKSINVQAKIRPCRVDLFHKINKHACTSIRYTRVIQLHMCVFDIEKI